MYPTKPAQGFAKSREVGIRRKRHWVGSGSPTVSHVAVSVYCLIMSLLHVLLPGNSLA